MFNPNHVKHAAIALTFAGLAGCTDEQIAIGLGVVGIGAGAAAIGVAAGRTTPPPPRYYHHGHYACVGGMRQSCSTYRNYRGFSQTTCRSVYDPCVRRDWVSYLEGAGASGENDGDSLHANVSSSDWAETFRMSPNSAEEFVSALKQARAGDAQALSDMGLGHGDLRSMAKLKMPSDAGVDRLAQKLDQAPEDTRVMLATLITEGAKLKGQVCSGDPRDTIANEICEQ